MKRRDFTGTVLATSAFSGVGATALAQGVSYSSSEPEVEDSNAFPAFDRVEFRMRDLFLVPTRLVVVQDDFSEEIGLDLTFPVNKTIMTPGLRQQLTGPNQIGDVLLNGNELVAVRTVGTSVRVSDGNVILIGGLRTYRIPGTLSEDIQDRVPLLGDLPIIGRLFQTRAEQNRNRNLLIFITPRIIRDAE